MADDFDELYDDLDLPALAETPQQPNQAQCSSVDTKAGNELSNPQEPEIMRMAADLATPTTVTTPHTSNLPASFASVTQVL